jgi:hypothetical protein
MIVCNPFVALIGGSGILLKDRFLRDNITGGRSKNDAKKQELNENLHKLADFLYDEDIIKDATEAPNTIVETPPVEVCDDKIKGESHVNIVINDTLPINKKTKKNIIFMDWDDTIYPTSHIIELEEGEVQPNDKYFKIYLKVMFKLMETVIDKASKLYIVSNASTGWLTDSMANTKFKDFVEKYKRRIEVISARDLHIDTTRSPIMWKQNVFVEKINQLKEKFPNDILNIVSIGDDKPEWVGIKRALKEHSNIYLKRIKCLYEPSLICFITQIECLSKIIKDVIKVEKNLDICFHIEQGKKMSVRFYRLGDISDVQIIDVSSFDTAKYITPYKKINAVGGENDVRSYHKFTQHKIMSDEDLLQIKQELMNDMKSAEKSVNISVKK